ncbi:MAG: rhodanese-like domain-containing protein [Elainellaceae cyanobacterium]
MFPNPPALTDRSRVYDLKARLDWGEPALTIVDSRDRIQFNTEHIMGAVAMPLETLVSMAQANLEVDRDIYIYGETDDETAEAAAKLRTAGYLNVSELRGGLSAWKAVGYPTESITAAA